MSNLKSAKQSLSFNTPKHETVIVPPFPCSEKEQELHVRAIIERFELSNYSDKSVFDRHVFQKFVALLYAYYAGDNPFYGPRRDTDSGDGSRVPRQPVAPRRSGGAAEPLPRPFDTDNFRE